MDTFYTNERNAQILIYLMKAHNIKKVVVSPGTTNIAFVASVQQDSYFEIFSSADERSAAYIACGLSEESGEPVALSCTGATASRNYIPGLTEAFYRKLPVLAITSIPPTGRIGQNFPQMVDRSTTLNDIVNLSVQAYIVHDKEEEWACGVKINEALLELRHHGGGPVHINLETTCDMSFNVRDLPPAPVIERICDNDIFPKLDCNRVGVFVGAHKKWSKELTNAIDAFCEAYNGVVICDQTSNYQGKYKIFLSLAAGQDQYYSPCRNMDVMIDIGNISGAYLRVSPNSVWRVNPDGVVRDTHRKLRYVFEMEEITFFKKYVELAEKNMTMSYYKECRYEYDRIFAKIPELPFSNIWIAKQTYKLLPKGCILHLGILNSLRAWNFFELSDVWGYANTGGFGIDGGVSSFVGASLAYPEKLYFGVIGDLAFFYDMNSVGNRHIGKNLRLMVINNGKGTEFKNYSHNASKFGDDANLYVAAAGHYGKQSKNLLKHYATDLGFEYMSASNKDEYLQRIKHFITPELEERSMIFEIFTDSKDESDALFAMNNIEISQQSSDKRTPKQILREKGAHALKRLIGK